MWSTKHNVAVVQEKYGSRRWRVSSMVNLTLWIVTLAPKIHNHVGASHLKSEQFHGTCLFHCAWLHRNYCSTNTKRGGKYKSHDPLKKQSLKLMFQKFVLINDKQLILLECWSLTLTTESLLRRQSWHKHEDICHWKDNVRSHCPVPIFKTHPVASLLCQHV